VGGVSNWLYNSPTQQTKKQKQHRERDSRFDYLGHFLKNPSTELIPHPGHGAIPREISRGKTSGHGKRKHGGN